MGFAPFDMKVTSADFKPGSQLPAKHAYDGGNVSPSLFWDKVPEGTRSIGVFCHDPDAPKTSDQGQYGFVHWVLYNIPADQRKLEEGVTAFAKGVNDFGEAGYGGPLPPEGHGTHHYYFWVVALDVEPDLPDGLDLCEFLERIEPHTLGMNRLVGTYER
jgi:Raf kinase inhibitor-like YbhB/YbcL family protein